jgi:hypothetical protein
MMTFPTEWINKIHVPNHQPVMVQLQHLVVKPLKNTGWWF